MDDKELQELREMFIEDFRLSILRFIHSNNGELNTLSAYEALIRTGHAYSYDVMINECYWLQEQGLLRMGSYFGVDVLKLTQRGVDVAFGRSQVKGVKPPAIGK